MAQLFSGNQARKPSVSVWEKLRQERIGEWTKLRDGAKELGYGDVDVERLTLRELNDLLRDVKANIKRLKEEIKKEERIEKIQAIRANRATTGAAAHERYKMIMEMMVKGSKSGVRSMDSQDVFTAFDELSDNIDGKLLTYQQFLDAVMPQDLNTLDPLDLEL